MIRERPVLFGIIADFHSKIRAFLNRLLGPTVKDQEIARLKQELAQFRERPSAIGPPTQIPGVTEEMARKIKASQTSTPWPVIRERAESAARELRSKTH